MEVTINKDEYERLVRDSATLDNIRQLVTECNYPRDEIMAILNIKQMEH